MAVILIMGDSWGVPNYFGPPGVPKTHHTAFLLENYGHTVYNCSMNGRSNLASLNKAENFISGQAITVDPTSKIRVTCDKEIDWILWFHTEFLREQKMINRNLSLQENLDVIGHAVYKDYADFINKHNFKTCVVGGQAELDQKLFEYINPNFHISNWRNNILKTTLPNSRHLLSQQKLISKLIKDKQEAMKIMDEQLLILNAMRNSSDFPDNCHPGTEPHRQLVSELVDIIK